MINPPLAPAILSECRQYRYMLSRQWDDSKLYLVICGLNPSTADETEDDNTIRKEMLLAKLWGFGGIIKLNLFAFRTKSPEIMKQAFDPVGPENDRFIKELSKYSNTVLLAWGNHGIFRERDLKVLEILKLLEYQGYFDIKALKINKNGTHYI